MINIAKDYPIIYGLVTFLLGGYFGHRLAIGRDRRKEFNMAATPIREALLKQLAGLSEKKYSPDAISNDQFISFGINIGKVKTSNYDKAVKEYLDCFTQHIHPDYNGQYYKVVRNGNFIALETAIKRLLKFCKLK